MDSVLNTFSFPIYIMTMTNIILVHRQINRGRRGNTVIDKLREIFQNREKISDKERENIDAQMFKRVS